jgi:hypothetical protein
MNRTLRLHPTVLAICRFEPGSPLPSWVFHEGATLWCVTRTPDELSVVCADDDLPPSVTKVERGWRAFQLQGPIPFEETGVLASLVGPLAAAGVPVFAISTWDTDWLLVRETNLAKARAVLEESFRVTED